MMHLAKERSIRSVTRWRSDRCAHFSERICRAIRHHTDRDLVLSKLHFFIAMSTLPINSTVVTVPRFAADILEVLVTARSGTQLSLAERQDGLLHMYSQVDRDNSVSRVVYIVTQNDIDDAIIAAEHAE